MSENDRAENSTALNVDNLALIALEEMLHTLPEDRGVLSWWANRPRNRVARALAELKDGQAMKAAEVIEENARNFRLDAAQSESDRQQISSPNWAFLMTGIVYFLEREHEDFNYPNRISRGERERFVFLHMYAQSSNLLNGSDQERHNAMLQRINILAEQLLPNGFNSLNSDQKTEETAESPPQN